MNLQKPKISIQKKSKMKKSVLKSSKSKIEENKKKIYKIIEDNLLLTKIKMLRDKNDLMFYNSANEAQNNFEDNMEKLFKEKMDKINEINKKYDNEIYELKQDIEEEDIVKKNNNNTKSNDNDEENDDIDSSLKLIYDNLLDDKKKEIENIEKEYNIKLNRTKDNYLENFESEELDERSIIYKNEMIGNLRTQIEDIINPQNNRKVNFDSDIK
jgi:hypothetical protein